MAVQKKKQTKVQKIISFFNPKNMKGGMALFALVFALGGAGYFVYSSFAAGGGGIDSYSVGANNMVLSGQTSKIHDTKLNTEPALNLVVKMATTKPKGYVSTQFDSSTIDSIVRNYAGHTYKMCAVARRLGTASPVLEIHGLKSANISDVFLTGDYSTYCLATATIPTAKAGYYIPSVTTFGGTSLSPVYLAFLTLTIY